MSASLVIRPASDADLAAIAALLVAQLRDHGNQLPDGALAAAATGMLTRPQRGQFLLAVEGDDVVGLAALSYLWTLERGGRAAWLDELYVVPARRGAGIGARLLAAALAAAAAAGAVAMDLEIETGHERAAALYQRAGFESLSRTRWARALPAAPRETPAPALPLDGGCLCGALRFRVSAAPLAVSHCHCTLCRRASGAPLVTWATVPSAAFGYLQGAPREWRATPSARRSFCTGCGTPLTFQADATPQLLDVTVASFDRPEAVPPTEHVWVSRRLPWLQLDDDLPRRPRGGGS
ncbi:MAG: GNAT family N-acetyltransferase [Deltaproteobacteria bacterium]|nr:GNAT family N-acetyltransferase [Deltaproteobacteria bacterium]